MPINLNRVQNLIENWLLFHVISVKMRSSVQF